MKVSIIIPCFNSENTINKCIDSVLNQTYKNTEIIAINDASTDNTLNLLKEYKSIRVIDNKTNKGIGYSRNIGLKESTGDYIMFVDSDDFIDSNMVEVLINNVVSSKAEMVICNYRKIVNNKCLENEYDFKDREVSLKSSPEILLNINLSPWNKIYKKELLKDNYFPEDLKYEDAIFVLKAFNKANKIKIINYKLYNYVVGNNTETSVVDQKVFDILKISELINKELKDNFNNEYLEAFMIRNLFRYTIQQKYQVCKELKNKFVDEVFLFLKTNFPNWKQNKIYNKRSFLKKLIEKNKFLTKLYIKF